jgi:Na+-driven multidrug efflux pump
MGIILYGSIFMMFSFGMNNFIRAEGKPGIAMATMLIGTALNAGLAPLFIFGFGWGMKGAAFATVVAQAVSAGWIMSHFLRGKSTLKLRIVNFKLVPSIILNIFAIGIAPFTMQAVQSVLTAVMNISLEKYGGDVAISGMGIVNSLATLVILPIIGINQGAQPIIGYNYGAHKFDRVKHTLKLAALAATIISTIGFAATHLFPTQLISLFNTEKELVSFGSVALVEFLIFLPIIGFQIVGSGYFQAVGKAKQSMILSLSRQVLILIPALLILPHFMGMQGILTAGPLSDLISSIITGLWLFAEIKSLNRKHNDVIDLDPV